MTKYQLDMMAKILKIETLEMRNSDRLDFHELHVMDLKYVIEAAYRLGLLDGSEGKV